MGAVAKATHLLRRAPVALKFMSPAVLALPGAVERFVNEGVAASQIDSDHVVKVFDVGRLPNGAPYLVMEFLDGLRPRAAPRARRADRARRPRAVHFTVQTLRALQTAHAAGIIHRDMKPSNCFVINKDGEPDFVKLVDFGISKVRASTRRASGANLTRTNSALGTPLYMSPEQARSPRDVDHRTDLYSVGAILYELLTGRTPYTSETGEFTEILFKIFTTDPEPLRATAARPARGAGGGRPPGAARATATRASRRRPTWPRRWRRSPTSAARRCSRALADRRGAARRRARVAVADAARRGCPRDAERGHRRAPSRAGARRSPAPARHRRRRQPRKPAPRTRAPTRRACSGLVFVLVATAIGRSATRAFVALRDRAHGGDKITAEPSAVLPAADPVPAPAAIATASAPTVGPRARRRRRVPRRARPRRRRAFRPNRRRTAPAAGAAVDDCDRRALGHGSAGAASHAARRPEASLSFDESLDESHRIAIPSARPRRRCSRPSRCFAAPPAAAAPPSTCGRSSPSRRARRGTRPSSSPAPATTSGALVEFQRAYDLSHNPRVLFNVGVTEKLLTHYARAVDAWDKELTRRRGQAHSARARRS